jgi:LacI family transcriptional regulator
MATIYDVSRESGFSVSTVSKVINNYSGVNKETSALINKK